MTNLDYFSLDILLLDCLFLKRCKIKCILCIYQTQCNLLDYISNYLITTPFNMHIARLLHSKKYKFFYMKLKS